jgi:hypothetical protein
MIAELNIFFTMAISRMFRDTGVDAPLGSLYTVRIEIVYPYIVSSNTSHTSLYVCPMIQLRSSSITCNKFSRALLTPFLSCKRADNANRNLNTCSYFIYVLTYPRTSGLIFYL